MLAKTNWTQTIFPTNLVYINTIVNLLKLTVLYSGITIPQSCSFKNKEFAYLAWNSKAVNLFIITTGWNEFQRDPFYRQRFYLRFCFNMSFNFDVSLQKFLIWNVRLIIIRVNFFKTKFLNIRLQIRNLPSGYMCSFTININWLLNVYFILISRFKKI